MTQPTLFSGAPPGPARPGGATRHRDDLGRLILLPIGARLRGEGKCGDCASLIARRYSKTYYKCLQIGTSMSKATDKRKSDPACTLYQPAEPPALTPAQIDQAAEEIGAAVGLRVTATEPARRPCWHDCQGCPCAAAAVAEGL